jgi:hypothetical protein
MDFDYKKYSLNKLEEWMHDTISGDASPQEIYDVIKGVVEEQYYYFKHHTGRCYDILCLLNGHRHIDLECDNNWEQVNDNLVVNKKGNLYPKDKVVKWSLPVEVDGPSAEYFVTFPDDLLEAANLKEGDKIEWIDCGDGSFEIKKVNV